MYWNNASKCNTFIYVVLTINVDVNIKNIHYVPSGRLLIHTSLIELDTSLFSHCYAVKFMKAFHHKNSDHLINMTLFSLDNIHVHHGYTSLKSFSLLCVFIYI